MHISEQRTSGVLILGLSKRLDASTTQTFEDRLLGLIDTGEHRLVLDLTQLEYVSSAGLRLLLLAVKRLRAADGKLALFGLGEHVRQVFEISGFASILSIHGSREAAIAYVQ